MKHISGKSIRGSKELLQNSIRRYTNQLKKGTAQSDFRNGWVKVWQIFSLNSNDKTRLDKTIKIIILEPWKQTKVMQQSNNQENLLKRDKNEGMVWHFSLSLLLSLLPTKLPSSWHCNCTRVEQAVKALTSLL